MDNEDYVICQICQKKLGVINHLHLRSHGYTTSEYTKKFPGAVLSSKSMLEKRSKKLKGKKRTEETKKKLSDSIKKSWKKNPNQGRTGHSLSEKSKKKLSEKLTGHFVSEETKKKIGESGLGREPWNKGLTKDDDPRLASISEKVSEWNKYFMTDEIKKKISKTLKLRYHNGMPIPHSATGFRDDLKMSFRSTWESNYARILKSKNIEIIYEKDRFSLYDIDGEIKHVYIPDFKLSNTHYIELKGHAKSKNNWDCNCERCIRDKNKLKLFSEQYPNIQLDLIGKEEYKHLSKEYSSIIENWEFYKNDRKINNLKWRKKMIRADIMTFSKPVCYFDDCKTPDPEEIRDVGEYINNILNKIADAVEKLQLDENWEMEFNNGEISLFNDQIENESEFYEYIKKLNIDRDLFYLIDLDE